MSFGMLCRLRVPEFAQSRSPIALKRGGQRIRFIFVLFMLLCCSAQQSYGAENRVDLANEINEAINTLQIASPNISWSEVQNVLIAAYCHAVARKPGLAAAEKWTRMREFDSVLERQIAANMMPTGTLIIANVPLPPDVYRELKRQALVSNQSAAQLMTAILTRAAGR
jgi:hypothetical protein